MNPTPAVFDASGQYTAAIAFVVGLVNNYAPYLGITTQSVITVISGIAVFYGIFRAYQAHRKLAVSVGAIKA